MRKICLVALRGNVEAFDFKQEKLIAARNAYVVIDGSSNLAETHEACIHTERRTAARIIHPLVELYRVQSKRTGSRRSERDESSLLHVIVARPIGRKQGVRGVSIDIDKLNCSLSTRSTRRPYWTLRNVAMIFLGSMDQASSLDLTN